MDLLVKQAWSSTGASGGLAAIEVPNGMHQTVLYIDCSTLATTQSASLMAAQRSTGPWFVEASTQIATAVSTGFGLRVTGPIGPYVRPYLHTASTGTYGFTLTSIG